jgi:hypothetical protein
MTEEIVEIEFRGAKLKVNKNGTVERYYKNKWINISDNKVLNGCGYIDVKLNHTNLRIHRLIYYAFNPTFDIENPKVLVDHINRIKNDNRIENLREVSHQQNQFNRSNTKGYTFNKFHNKFNASIRINKKNIHLGYFPTEDEARDAYIKAKEKYHII